MITEREKMLMMYAVRAGYRAGLFQQQTTDEELIQKAVDVFVRNCTPIDVPANNDHEQDGN